MRVSVAIAAVAALVAIASCTGTGQNTVDIFTVNRGPIDLRVEVSPEESALITSVEFRVDGGPIGTDSEGPDWSVQFDTTQVADGVHYITAVGNPGGDEVLLLENSIIVQNGGAAVPPAQYKGAR